MQPWNGVAGKRVLITGATSGIGLAAAMELARRGAQLVMIARSQTKAEEAARRIRAPAGIVTTSSAAHQGARIPFDDMSAERSWGSSGFRRYGETKLANVLFTVELARRLDGTGVTANAFHPGFVASAFNRDNGPLMRIGMALSRPFARSARKGAETLVWLVDSEAAGDVRGGYFFDMRRVTPSPAASDREAALRLWNVSEAQVS